MDKQQIKELLIRYEKGECTEHEKAQLETWYIKQEIPSVFHLSEPELNTELSKIWLALEEEYKIHRTRPLWPKIAVAASILLLITIGLYFYLYKNSALNTSRDKIVKTVDDVQPGVNKAILIHASGKQEQLDKEILIASEQPNNTDRNSASYNTVVTPKGGQYQVILADGTHVWLNAASSLKYPISFSGNERRVEISGEAYFEVAHNASKPFKVMSDNQVIEVLGTHFNINTYTDEPAIKTTLLEGAVKISLLSKNKSELILKPGEQAIHIGNHISKNLANTEETVAWKNGFFQFDNASLENVMRQISRWYDLEVEYKGQISKRVFNGKVYRNMTLSKVLSVLSFSKVNYKIEGKKLIVMP